MCRCGGRTIGQVARDFDLTETVVRDWVKQTDLDAGVTEQIDACTTPRPARTDLRKYTPN